GGIEQLLIILVDRLRNLDPWAIRMLLHANERLRAAQNPLWIPLCRFFGAESLDELQAQAGVVWGDAPLTRAPRKGAAECWLAVPQCCIELTVAVIPIEPGKLTTRPADVAMGRLR